MEVGVGRVALLHYWEMEEEGWVEIWWKVVPPDVDGVLPNTLWKLTSLVDVWVSLHA